MTSKSTVLAVVVLLGLVALVSLAGAIFLVGIDKSVPDGIWTLGAGAAGAAAGGAASSRGKGLISIVASKRSMTRAASERTGFNSPATGSDSTK